MSLGRVKVLPTSIRTPATMALPLLVLVVMLWWLWRVRYRARGRRLAMQARAA